MVLIASLELLASRIREFCFIREAIEDKRKSIYFCVHMPISLHLLPLHFLIRFLLKKYSKSAVIWAYEEKLRTPYTTFLYFILFLQKLIIWNHLRITIFSIIFYSLIWNFLNFFYFFKKSKNFFIFLKFLFFAKKKMINFRKIFLL